MIRYYVKKKFFRLLKTGEKKEKYTIELFPIIRMGEKEMAARVEKASTFAGPEFELAMALFTDQAIKAMNDGRAVQVGELGWLLPRISATPVDNEKDATAEKTLKKVSYYFRPSKQLSRILNEIPLRKVMYIPQAYREAFGVEDTETYGDKKKKDNNTETDTNNSNSAD